MKHLLGRSLAVAPLLLGLTLGSSGLAAAATSPAAVTSHAHPAKVVHHARHLRAKKLKHTRKVTRVTHPVTAATAATGASSTTGPTAVPAVVLTPFEARLVFLVNQARAANGVPALTVSAGTTDVARRWALKLAGDDVLSHNPQISQDLQAAGSPDWTFIAENVGSTDAGDADGLFAAYMSSPHHRDNILDPRAVEIGMGAVTTPEVEGDTTYNTMDFVNSYNPAYGVTHTHPVAAELSLAGLAGALS